MAQKKFELKIVFTIDADNEQTMKELEEIKNDVLSGKAQRDLIDSGGGIVDAKVTFTELK